MFASEMLTSSIHDFLFNEDVENKLLYRNRYLLPSIIITYVLFVTRIGPKYMKNRNPYKLRTVLVVYNFVEVIVNAYIAVRVANFLLNNGELFCLSKINLGHLFSLRFQHLAWLILLNKLSDLLDTVFFVLRKKNNQVSILHVIHHITMPLLLWWGLLGMSYTGGYYLGVGLGLNAVVHAFMYLYYGLSAIGPSMAKYLWWKKYITLMQIIQFVIFLSYMIFGFATGCETPGKMEISISTFVLFLLIMFWNFYKRM
ncbi:elongation of very long chain fatty acids protein 4-like isoform X1 [Argiope bruennichi]|uniref:elongation of very long chain fatty acids protein 4-like isoform X1 n=1 Tax=Argiope bruennichi TaxID=94029 RepID=UPI002493EF53|nr:elongation of very long chain fatty acids protein 4-like isoform X1 [Argiope bruennichi]XP_055934225.1 elongation of very long chain fatty acids protein 4-like isoform X1 [Argiope bruennichi]